MGLFDDAKENIEKGSVEETLKALGVNMEHISVHNQNGKTVISGSVSSDEELAKVQSKFGGMFGGVTHLVDLDVVQMYTVQDGDSPWAIAQKFWGDGNKYPYLVEVNDGKENLHTGDVLKVPSVRSYIGGQKLQAILTALGYNVGALDGVVGANTKAALVQFQQKQDLAANGELNNNTRQALRAAFKTNVQSLNGAPLQVVLKEVGHNPGTIDGVVGANTQNAVKAFQTAKGLSATGTVDAQTLQQLMQQFV